MLIKEQIVDELLQRVDLEVLFSSEGLLPEIKKALAERTLKAELEQRQEVETAAMCDGAGKGNHSNR
jgi:hypothetical protein